MLYTWFHIYRPVGAEASPELCLTPDQQRQARRFVVEMRAKKPIVIVDAYYDGEGYALCPAATGFTNHIGPWGDIEPCPVIQIASDSIYDERPLKDVFGKSAFLKDFRRDSRRLYARVHCAGAAGSVIGIGRTPRGQRYDGP